MRRHCEHTCVFGHLGNAAGVIGGLRTGYLALFCLAGAFMLSAMALNDYPWWQYFMIAGRGSLIAVWFVPAFLWFAWVGALVTLRRSERPLRTAYRISRVHKYRLIRGTVFASLLMPLGMAFAALKRMIPHVLPFYADPMIAVTTAGPYSVMSSQSIPVASPTPSLAPSEQPFSIGSTFCGFR